MRLALRLLVPALAVSDRPEAYETRSGFLEVYR